MAQNEKYRKMLEEIEDARPVGDFSKDEFIGWLTDLAFARGLLRDYSGAADAAKDALELQPSHPLLHVNLADFLGRMNRYEDAAGEARAAMVMCSGGAPEMSGVFYLSAVHSLATWEWAQGQKEHSLEVIEGIIKPEDLLEQWVYHSLRCVFWAVTGEEEKLKSEIEAAFSVQEQRDDLDKEYCTAFFERDIVYDPYRKKDWFIRRFGESTVE